MKAYLVAFAIVVGIIAVGVGAAKLAEATAENERKSYDRRASAMGRTFLLNGHTYTSINGTFGGSIECVSGDAPDQVLSVSAVLALTAQYDAAKGTPAPVEKAP